MAKTTLIGKLLNRIRYERQQARELTSAELYSRNHVPNNHDERAKYKIEETKIVTSDGVESIKLELWHKVDEQVVNITTEVITQMIKEESKNKEEWP